MNLTQKLRDIFIKISGGGEVDHKITCRMKPSVINKIQEPVKETIQQKTQNPITEPLLNQFSLQVKVQLPEVIKQKSPISYSKTSLLNQYNKKSRHQLQK